MGWKQWRSYSANGSYGEGRCEAFISPGSGLQRTWDGMKRGGGFKENISQVNEYCTICGITRHYIGFKGP